MNIHLRRIITIVMVISFCIPALAFISPSVNAVTYMSTNFDDASKQSWSDLGSITTTVSSTQKHSGTYSLKVDVTNGYSSYVKYAISNAMPDSCNISLWVYATTLSSNYYSPLEVHNTGGAHYVGPGLVFHGSDLYSYNRSAGAYQDTGFDLATGQWVWIQIRMVKVSVAWDYMYLKVGSGAWKYMRSASEVAYSDSTPDLYYGQVYTSGGVTSYMDDFKVSYGADATWKPTFTSTPLTRIWYGASTSYSYSITVNETATTTAINIPSWLSLSNNGTTTSPWVLSGTTTLLVSGAYNIKVKSLSSSGGLYAYQNFTLYVNRSWSPTLTSYPDIDGNVSILYSSSFTINETGTVTAINIPSWATLSHNGTTTSPWVLSGTPTTATSYNVKIRLNSTSGFLNSYCNYTLTVGAGVSATWYPTYTSSPVNYTMVNVAYTYHITLNESSSISIITKPSWLTYANTYLNGTPSVVGSYTVIIQATSTNGKLKMNQGFVIRVYDNSQSWYSTFTSSPVNYTLVNVAYTYHITLNESSSISIVTKPTWLSYANGYLNGTPSVVASYTVTIKATSTNGHLDSFQGFVIRVYSNPANQTWASMFTSLPNTSVQASVQYSYRITTNETSIVAIMYSVSWLSMTHNNSAGNHYLNGSTAIVGNYTIKISCYSVNGHRWSYQNYSIYVMPIPPSIYNQTWFPVFTSMPSTMTFNNTTYSYIITLNESCTITILSKPSWLVYSNYTLIGVSNSTGVFNISIRAYSISGHEYAYQNYSLNVTSQSNGNGTGGFHLNMNLIILIVWMSLGILFSILGLMNAPFSIISGFVWVAGGVVIFMPINQIMGILILGIGFMFMVYGIAGLYNKKR